MAVIRLKIAYSGTNFRGLAPNPGVRTVVGELITILTPVLKFKPEIVMSGRTDAGVHSTGQVLSIQLPADFDDADFNLEVVGKCINSRLGPEVVAQEVAWEPDSFSARFSAVRRHYSYTVLNSQVPDPFWAPTAWWVKLDSSDTTRLGELDLRLMNQAANKIVGEHDFSTFCRRPKTPAAEDPQPVSLVRRVESAEWYLLDHASGRSGVAMPSANNLHLLRFDISGSAFCHQMVRSLVGFLVAVGSGKRAPNDIEDALEARDRAMGENLAPPHGLTLRQVDYE